LALARLKISYGLVCQLIQFAGQGIGFQLFIPILGVELIKPFSLFNSP
jgi:hypothetical protein